VSPSRWEPWGNIVPEAMSLGKVVIASSSIASGVDRISEGVNGLVFPTDNVAELVNHLSKAILDQDFSERISVGAKYSADVWSADANAIFLASYLN
jgi:glycosyltransferase involved in cell wall biosynthesis